MLALRICAGWFELLLLTLLFPLVPPYLVAREAARSDESRAQVLLLLRRGMLLALLLATWPFVALYLIARKLARALSACGPGAADARDNADDYSRRSRGRSPRRRSPPPSGRPGLSPPPQRKSPRRRRR